MDILLREAPYQFPGGIDLPAMKEMSTNERIGFAPIPSQLILPLKQHAGLIAKPIVTVGEHVLKGQLIAETQGEVSANLHAPTSGSIISIAPHPVPHASGQTSDCIRLIPDGEDLWIERPVTPRDYQSLNKEDIVKVVRDFGIVGLGGAVFPTENKIKSSGVNLKALIINGAECEPYISCDDMLMREYAQDIIEGIKILLQISDAPRCILAIENNKPTALTIMREALRDTADPRIELFSLPSLYPQGGEKQLLQSLTNEQIPKNGLPLGLGYLILNVGTVKAVRDAIMEDQPLISRVVTVTGNGVKHPQNVMTLIGTPIIELIEFCGGYQSQSARPHQLIMGGPLMGVSLSSDSVPVVKAMNCILVASQKDTQPILEAKPCIRCGECAQVCPASLLPQQLYWYSKSKNYAEAERFNLFDCIECGACDYVCPSHIPLVQYFRHAKGEVLEQQQQKQASDVARDRFEFREERLQDIANERAAKLAAKKSRMQNQTQSNKSAIDEIMQRVNNKKNQEGN